MVTLQLDYLLPNPLKIVGPLLFLALLTFRLIDSFLKILIHSDREKTIVGTVLDVKASPRLFSGLAFLFIHSPYFPSSTSRINRITPG
jgi:hypothetical protein